MALVLEKIVTGRFDNPDAPHIAGYEATGGYETPFLVTAGVTLAAALVVLLARPVRPPADAREPAPA